jgi:subtilisin family serine protease
VKRLKKLLEKTKRYYKKLTLSNKRLAAILSLPFLTLGLALFVIAVKRPIDVREKEAAREKEQNPFFKNFSSVPECVPGELIVRYKKNIDPTQIAPQTYEPLYNLEQKYHVYSKDEVFKDIGSPQEKIIQLEQYLSTLPASEQQEQQELINKLKARQQRAPQGAAPVDLSNIYLLKFDSNRVTLSQEEEWKFSSYSKFNKHSDQQESQEKLVELYKILKVVQELSKDPNIEYAEPNYIAYATSLPNDTYIDPDQNGTWSTGTWGQSYEDMWGLKKIEGTNAWSQSKGDGVIVAVIDTGVDYNHEDISGNVDTTVGYDFINNDDDPMDDNGHGTHVAGTIAAIENNSKGIAGVAPEANIMAIKALDQDGVGSYDNIASGINYATNNGAEVINLSLGGIIPANILKNALTNAYANGVVVLASAGNDGRDIKQSIPACYEEVLAVAASDQNDLKTYFSSLGNLTDITAPGGGESPNILSLRASGTDLYCDSPPYDQYCNTYIVDQKYYRAQGTSMAAPHVSGLTTQLVSEFPADSVNDLRGRIVAGVDSMSNDSSFNHGYTGSGRINAQKALSISETPYFKINKDVTIQEHLGDGDGVIESFEQVKVFVNLKNFWKSASNVQATFSTTSSYVSSVVDNSANYGSITQNQEKENSNDPFIVELKESFLETPVPFVLQITSGGYSQSVNGVFHFGTRRITSSSAQVDIWSDIDIDDDKIVWGDLKEGLFNGQIYLYDLQTNQEIQVTNNSWDNYCPVIYGHRIAWIRNEYGERKIILYDMNTQEETVIETGEFRGIDIYEDKIVYRQSGTGLVLYDISTSESKTLTTDTLDNYKVCETSFVHDNKVVWAANGEINLYNINTDTSEIVTSGNDPAIHGNKIIYYDSSGRNKLLMYNLDTEEEITLSDTKCEAFCDIDINNNYVAYSNPSSGLGFYGTEFQLYNINTQSKHRFSFEPSSKVRWNLSDDKVIWLDTRDGRWCGNLMGLACYDLYVTSLPQVVLSPTPTSIAYPDWKGEYFNNENLQGTPVLVRNDQHITFNWGDGSPNESVNNDHFSARWTRTVNFSQGTYFFRAWNNDGMRIYIDGVKRFDGWDTPFDVRDGFYITLTQGNHNIKVEYKEETGAAVAIVEWWVISSTPTPSPSLTPTLSPTPTPSPTPVAYPDWKGEYYNNKTLSGSPTLTRNDQTINFTWNEGGPHPSINVDRFSVRWTRTYNLTSAGDYTFHAKTDDGMKVWVGGALKLNVWKDQSPTDYTFNINLSQGNHDIKVEYYENGGLATARLWWEKATATFSNLSATMNRTNATFYFNYTGSGTQFIIDASTLADMSWDVYINFVQGLQSPIYLSNPTKWDKYTCGRTLYWRVKDNQGNQSSIKGTTINCN